MLICQYWYQHHYKPCPLFLQGRNTMQQEHAGSVWGLHAPAWDKPYGQTLLCPPAIFTDAKRLLVHGESNHRKSRLLGAGSWMTPRRVWTHLSISIGFPQVWALLSQVYQSNQWDFDGWGFVSPFLQPPICKMQIHRSFVALNVVCEMIPVLRAEEPERQLMILHSAESLDCLY